MTPFTRTLLAVVALTFAAPALAHHRQTPPVLALTATGDTPLPRVPAPGNKTIVLAIDAGPGRKIVSISPWKNRREPDLQTLIQPLGANDNPAISLTGRAAAFDSASDPADEGLPGRQVVGAFLSAVFPVSSDPTGTSMNPSIDTTGRLVAFESTGDLAGTGNPGARQVFLRDHNGSIRQLSTGVGASRNPALSAKQHFVVFESTSDPTSGVDTGIAQIWLGSVDGEAGAAPITNGFGPSIHPAVSNDGRLVVFESTADLGADVPVDTGVPQIYLFDTKTVTYARITDDVLGCTLPSVYKAYRDWRIAFVCSGQPFFYMVRGDQRYRVPTEGGTTQRVIAELGVHFLVMSTTANLLDGTVTTGNQVYLVNLFKRPGQPVPGQASWFPSRGIPPL